MLIMGEQHNVDGPDIIEADCRALCLRQRSSRRRLVDAGRTESWVGEQAQPADFEHGGGPPDDLHAEAAGDQIARGSGHR